MNRSRTRYPHVFSGLRQSAMPEPNHRPPWRIEERLVRFAIRELIERRVTVVIECDACQHVAKWTAADLKRRLSQQTRRSLAWIAPKLRCSRCRSSWVRLWAEPTTALPVRSDVWR